SYIYETFSLHLCDSCPHLFLHCISLYRILIDKIHHRSRNYGSIKRYNASLTLIHSPLEEERVLFEYNLHQTPLPIVVQDNPMEEIDTPFFLAYYAQK